MNPKTQRLTGIYSLGCMLNGTDQRQSKNSLKLWESCVLNSHYNRGQCVKSYKSSISIHWTWV